MEFQDILVYIIVAIAVAIWMVSLIRSLFRIASSRGKSGEHKSDEHMSDDKCKSRGCDGDCNNCNL